MSKRQKLSDNTAIIYEEVEVKEEFIETAGDETGKWSCLEIDRPTGVERAISFDNVKHNFSDESALNADIGDQVVTTIDGRSVNGTLVCDSGMGITPIDLFNDILTTEKD